MQAGFIGFEIASAISKPYFAGFSFSFTSYIFTSKVIFMLLYYIVARCVE